MNSVFLCDTGRSCRLGGDQQEPYKNRLSRENRTREMFAEDVKITVEYV